MQHAIRAVHYPRARDQYGKEALRLIRSAVSGSKELTRAEFDHGRWAVARAFNLNLATATDWVRGALYVGRQGWDLATVDDAPRVLSSIDRSRLVASLRRCADEGVLSIVGDETVVRRVIAEAWK